MRIDAYTIVGEVSEGGLCPEDLIKQMEAANVDKCVIAPVERCLAVANREGNEYVMAAAKKHPNKFIPTCTANPWYGDDAIAEANHWIESGARIFVLAPHLQGFVLNDGTTFPLLQSLEKTDVPVYVHTGHYEHSTPFQLVDVAMRFPSISFIMGHSGSTDFKADAVYAARRCQNIYLESSLVKSFVFHDMVHQTNINRCIVGSSAPLNNIRFEWEQMLECLPYANCKNIYGENLMKLIGDA